MKNRRTEIDVMDLGSPSDPTIGPGPRGRVATHDRACLGPKVGWLLPILVLLFLSCKSSTEPEVIQGISIRLDAVPLLLKADSVSVGKIWATVLEDGSPVADSTRVSFATSLGSIDADAFTKDGLARADFLPGQETGIAAIVGQVKAVRDTVLITLY